MIASIAKAGIRLLEQAASVIGVRSWTEEPPYEVEKTLSDVQIRRYGARIAAETTVFADEEAEARNQGFRRLAGYIFGGNNSRTTIAMTAPVTQQRANADGKKIAMTAPVSQTAGPDGGWVIRFYMPARWTSDTLPIPNDATVKLVTVPPETFAVLRFRGSWGRAAIAARTAQLMSAAQTSGYQLAGAPISWFYDPPWTIPLLRRNEVAVAVTPRS
jgi:hypothetical protein